jgi:outer membrane protein assembly factor BamB
MVGNRSRLLVVVGLVVAIVGAWPAVSRAATATAPATARASDEWPQYAGSADHVGVNALDPSFTRTSVTTMHTRWTGDIGGQATSSSPVVANGIVYVGSADGDLDAFNAAGCLDAFSDCEPLWTGHTRNGIYGAPAVDGNTVFVASADRHLYAFDARGCGNATTCAPVWRGWLGSAALTSIAIANGTVYVTNYGGKLLAFAASGCGETMCHPRWTGSGAGHSTSAAAVSGGFVYFGTYRGLHGHLYAFAAGGCAAVTCKPVWQASLSGVGFSSPTLARGNLYISSGTFDGGGVIAVFRASGCGAAECAESWHAVLGDDAPSAAPAVSGSTLLVAAQGSLDPNREGVVEAFPADGCGHRACTPTWTGGNFGAGSESAPVVTNGIVLIAKGPASGVPVDAGVYAFKASGCGAPNCDPIAFFQVGTAQDYLGSSIAVGEGLLFFASFDNNRNRSTLYVLEA